MSNAEEAASPTTAQPERAGSGSTLTGAVVAVAERRHGTLRSVTEVTVREVIAESDMLHRADRSAWREARRRGMTCGVVADSGRLLVVALSTIQDPDALRLVDDGPQLMSWCRPEGFHPIMRLHGQGTLLRSDAPG